MTQTEERVPCPRCGQRSLAVEQRLDGKFYRSTHGFDPDGSIVCRGSHKPLTGVYHVEKKEEAR